jgi:hypothetical protein
MRDQEKLNPKAINSGKTSGDPITWQEVGCFDDSKGRRVQIDFDLWNLFNGP